MLLRDFAIWACPDQKCAARLRAEMQRLITLRPGPAFEPHVTLYAGANMELEAVIQAVANCAHDRFCVRPSGIASRPTFLQALFLEFGGTDTFHALAGAITSAWGIAAGSTLNPHLSLWYGEPLLEGVTPKHLEFDLSLPICFSALTIVAPDAQGGWYDVASWKEYYRKQLS